MFAPLPNDVPAERRQKQSNQRGKATPLMAPPVRRTIPSLAELLDQEDRAKPAGRRNRDSKVSAVL